MDKRRNWAGTTFLSDFDGTIKPWNDYRPYPIAIRVIKRLYDAGVILGLNTCRNDDLLNQAVLLMEDWGILGYFSKINEPFFEYMGDIRKLNADGLADDMCWDAMGLTAEEGWAMIEQHYFGDDKE